jgi:chromosome segregation ATPase
VKRIEQWKAKLKAAQSDLNHKKRQYNAAERSMARTAQEIRTLEEKINAY